jgi:PD-(D/E)XK endonuclease
MAFQTCHTPVLFRVPRWLTVPAGPEAVQSRTRKQKGDLAELKVACDLRRRGYGLAIPFGEECDYDLIVDRDGVLERVQVKYTESDRVIIDVRCNSHSLTKGKVRATKRYTADNIDWLAVYDRTTDRCYYIPAFELGDGRYRLSLRLAPTRNSHGREFATRAATTT